MQSLAAAAKIVRVDADKKHNQKEREDFRVSCRDDMNVYMLKEAFCQFAGDTRA